MKTSVVTKAVFACLTIAATSAALKGLLEKKIFYTAEGKRYEAAYWAIYFGDYKANLVRKFPGEDAKPIEVGMSIKLLSSGYMQGTAYSAKGKVDITPNLFIKDGSEPRKIGFEDIDAIYASGERIRLLDGTDTELFIRVDDQYFKPQRAMLRRYSMITDQYGDKKLKEEENSEKIMSAFSFTKEGLAKAEPAR